MLGIAFYIGLGVLAGFLAGLLGIGGGVIIVPGLAYVFSLVGMPANAVMHMATSTSLAAIVFTTLTAVVTQHLKRAIVWSVFWQLAPGIITGTLLGTLLANALSNHLLRLLFGIFVGLTALHLLFFSHSKTITEYQHPLNRWLVIVGGVIIGGCSGLLGVGGGVFAVPILLRLRLTIHQAAATSSACAFLLSLVGTLSYMITGWHLTGLPLGSTGYVYWPAVLAIALSSIPLVPLGTKLAQHLSADVLIRVFAIFLLLITVDMLVRF